MTLNKSLAIPTFSPSKQYGESVRSQYSLGLHDLELRSIYQKTHSHKSIEIITDKN
jgi:hypothetical protein